MNTHQDYQHLRHRYARWEREITQEMKGIKVRRGEFVMEAPKIVEILIEPPIPKVIRGEPSKEVKITEEPPEKKVPNIISHMREEQYIIPAATKAFRKEENSLPSSPLHFTPYFNDDTYLTTGSWSTLRGSRLELHVELPGGPGSSGELWLYPFGEKTRGSLGIPSFSETELAFEVCREDSKSPDPHLINAYGTLLLLHDIYYVRIHTFYQGGGRLGLEDLELPLIFKYQGELEV